MSVGKSTLQLIRRIYLNTHFAGRALATAKRPVKATMLKERIFDQVLDMFDVLCSARMDFLKAKGLQCRLATQKSECYMDRERIG